MDINEIILLYELQNYYLGTNGESKMDLKENVEGGEIKCEICGKNFFLFWQFYVYKQIYIKFKFYVCRFCGDRFLKVGLRIIYERVYLGEIGYVCALCVVFFISKGSFRVYIKRQYVEGFWICKYCGSIVEV